MNLKLIFKGSVKVIDDQATGTAARAYREVKNVSLRNVARMMDFSAPYVSDLELGRRSWNESLLEAFTKAVKSCTEDAR